MYLTLRICGYMARKARPCGRKNPLPFSFSKRSPISGLRQTLQGKGVIHKRVETAGVYPLVPPPGRRTPSWGSAENSPPVRGELADAVRVPRLSGAEKEPPGKGEPACGSSRTPAFRCRKGAALLGRTRCRSSRAPLSRCRKQVSCLS